MTTSLMRRGAAYYFRQRVPVDLVGRFGCTELKRSLGTNDPREARKRLIRVRARADELFDDLRRKPMITEDDCLSFARWWHKVCVDENWHARQLAQVHPQGKEINDGFVETRAEVERNIIRELQSGDIGRVIFNAQLELEESGRADDTDENSPDFRRLCAYMLRGALEATRRAKAEDEGEFGYTARDPLFRDQHIIPGVVTGNLPQQGANPHPSAAPPVASPQPAPAGPTIGDLVEPFISEKTTRAKVSTKTQDDYRASLRLFLQVVGADRPVAAITDEEVVKFKEMLLQCPTNFRKRLKTDNLEEAIRRNSALPENKRLDCLDGKTINEKYLSNIKTFFTWAKANKKVKESPAIGVRAEQPARDVSDERDPFNLDDMRVIFGAPIFTGCRSAHFRHEPGDLRLNDHHFWTPLIAAFSGCRMNEIGQLTKADIVQLNDMPHFLITNADDDHKVKTRAGKRYIPVHGELIALGFLDFVNSIKSGRLFPEWEMGQDGYYSSSFSKKFSRFLKSIGIKTDKKSFHSFRHSFKDAMRAARLDGPTQDLFMGHEDSTVQRRYGIGTPIQEQSEDFLRITYKGLDLRSLKRVMPGK
ncbi:site-specific integrase [Paramagnetospirillum magnetotacticum]|uniref:site-specific integrase n=1 Tax=Paramagnetospirillum magnetotacticum TaxID=188 RepID=UPI0009E240ED|nr:site-specific integrase [Paramagnetospirillum magnetotacticum]